MKEIKPLKIIYTKKLLAEMQQRSIEYSLKKDREESLQRLRECYRKQQEKQTENEKDAVLITS